MGVSFKEGRRLYRGGRCWIPKGVFARGGSKGKIILRVKERRRVSLNKRGEGEANKQDKKEFDFLQGKKLDLHLISLSRDCSWDFNRRFGAPA